MTKPAKAGPGTRPRPLGGELTRHRDFRLLWAGEAVSDLGSGVSVLAIPLLAVRSLHAGTFEVSALTAAGSAAYLVVSLPAGALVDRMRRRPVMIATDAGRFLAVGSIPAAAALGVLSLGQLYAVTFLAGVLTVFFTVAYQAYLPTLIGRDQLTEGNSKLTGSSQLASIAAPGLAGWLVQAFGGAYAIAADAVSFLVSLTALRAIRTSETPGHGSAESRRRALKRLRSDIGDGARFVADHRVLRTITGVTALFNFWFYAAMSVNVVFLVRTLHQPPAVIGLLSAATGVGGVLAAVMASRTTAWLGLARGTIAGLAMCALGSLLRAATGQGPAIITFAVGSLLTGLGVITFNINQVTYRQRACPDHLLGRVIASMRFVIWGIFPLGALAGGALGATFGTRVTLWIATAGMTAGVLWLLASPFRTLAKAAGN